MSTGSGNERVVWLYGTGATSISSYSPAAASSFTATGSSTATGAADLSQPIAGPTASGAQAGAPSAPWGAQVITLQSPPASLTIARPGNAAAGDFLLATITAQGVGTGHICAPNDGTWTRVADTGQGSLDQATFSSVRATAGAENYTFTFRSGNCPSSGTALTGISASAVVVRYTGVDAVTPLDDKKTAVGPDPNPGTTLDAPAVTTSQLNDRIVDIYGTSATSFSGGTTFAQPGSSTATGISDVSQAPAKLEPAPLPTATSGASGDWIVQAFALRDTRAELTIARPSNVADNDLLLVSVTAAGLGAAGNICAPDSSWKAVGTPVIANPVPGSGSVTEQTFRSFRVGTDPETYTFTFSSGACGASSDANPAASAVAVRYTGVDPASPIDDVKSAGATAQSGAPTAPAATASAANERVIRFYGTAATSFTSGTTFNQPGTGTATGAYDDGSSPAGNVLPHSVAAPSAWWVAQTIVLTTRHSITIERPPNPSDFDFIIVSVSASNLGATGQICAPNDGTWHLLDQQRQQPAPPQPALLTQATFYSFRSTAADEHYEFDFRAGTCSGTPIGANASALAVRYTGVNPLSPIDPVMQQSFGVGTGTNGGTTPVAPAVTTNGANEQIVRLYGLGGASALSGLGSNGLSVTGTSTATGFEDAQQPLPGDTHTASASSTGRNLLWIAQTFALVPSGTGCSNNCWYGVQALSNSSTSYSGAITSAQAALAASNRPDAQKVIIFLSDGAANTPSGSNPCQAGISAAQTAEAAGTWVYTIAYDTQGDTCTEDNVSMTGLCAMHLIADNQVTDPDYAGDTLAQTQAGVCTGNQSSDPQNRFYSEAGAGDLTQVFSQIGYSLSSARLISDSAS